MTLFRQPPSSICILRLSAIGDVCNTVAAVKAIQRQWPSTEIVWVTGHLESKLISDLEGIKVVTFDKSGGWKAYINLWKALRNYHFDALLHMQYALRASLATLGIKSRYKLGFDSSRSQDFQTLFTNIKVPSPNTMHVLDGLLAFGKTLGITNMQPVWGLHYSSTDLEWASKHISNEKPNLVVVPAASKSYKNWNASGYQDVINHALGHGWNVLLAGSPARVELELAQEIQGGLNESVTDLVGKSSLKEMLAIIDKADLIIAPDTGPTHMANTMTTPVIGLYAHHNPNRTGPYRYLDYVVSAYEEAILEETGKDLTQLNWRARAKDKNAMNRISSDSVIKMFDKVTQELNLLQ
ncbi:glycosyl transferase [Vibrio lentus]|uniref:glycosyltransferase family 9 protein n=1 Tax=Vibrio lentus TaxID=136468 RepID=UPI000C83289F|nr:glycosyltransferase family 9 protein [Vibrio lentus]PMG18063.1 glycosyl transferase [Vibrio lentus]PMH14615.1 glycosyl transferase [Vibrio lentus]PMK97739.1 glycosyl transferase [Vibrio lentus]PMN15467.1 glycosyl transferase [Vibrio lentus]PMN48494.1 glycosyl transferase [Vibrio lentus]